METFRRGLDNHGAEHEWVPMTLCYLIFFSDIDGEDRNTSSLRVFKKTIGSICHVSGARYLITRATCHSINSSTEGTLSYAV